MQSSPKSSPEGRTPGRDVGTVLDCPSISELIVGLDGLFYVRKLNRTRTFGPYWFRADALAAQRMIEARVEGRS